MLEEFLMRYLFKRHPKRVAAAVGGVILVMILFTVFNSITPSVETTSKQGVSDTVLWFNGTYGILTARQGGDINLVGGYNKKDKLQLINLQESVESSWGITNREEAEETIAWLTGGEGHNYYFLEEYKSHCLDEYTREEVIELTKDLSKEDQAYFLCLYDAVETYGENAILAWDLERAIQLLGMCYLLDLYTYEEAMDQSLEIAERLQSIYTSWDDMMESYFYGFQYWNEDNPEDKSSEYYKRRKLYEELKAQEDSPYNLPWNLEFQKDW